MRNLKVVADRKDRKGGHIESGYVVDVKKSPAPECDTMFVRLRRKGEEATVLYLRPDEVLDIAWVCITSLMNQFE